MTAVPVLTRPLSELRGLCPVPGCRNISGAAWCMEHAALRGRGAGDPDSHRTCAIAGCPEPARMRTSASGRVPVHCLNHAGEAQRRALHIWRQRHQATASAQTAGLGELGELVGDLDLYLVALKGARNGKAADPALVARRRAAAEAALTAVVEAWRRLESAGCENAARGESPRAPQDGGQTPAHRHTTA